LPGSERPFAYNASGTFACLNFFHKIEVVLLIEDVPLEQLRSFWERNTIHPLRPFASVRSHLRRPVTLTRTRTPKINGTRSKAC